MSRPARVANQCPTGKITWETAAKVRKFIRARKNPRHPLRPYRCPLCEMWHTTTQKQRTQV